MDVSWTEVALYEVLSAWKRWPGTAKSQSYEPSPVSILLGIGDSLIAFGYVKEDGLLTEKGSAFCKKVERSLELARLTQPIR